MPSSWGEFSIQVTLSRVGRPAPLKGKEGFGTAVWLLRQQAGSTVRSEPPDALRVMELSGQRICFHALFRTTSTSGVCAQVAYDGSLVVKPVSVAVKPPGSRGPRSRSARTPLTNSSRLAVPAGTAAR